jgi:nucleotide-binding universal stress UspA family protein
MATPAFDGDGEPRVILAALSMDETGEFALFEAARMARSLKGSDLHVVHVVEEDGHADSSLELLALEKRLSQAPGAIADTIDRLRDHLPGKVTAHVRAGRPSRSILQTAVDIDADVIVVGSHQRRRLEKLMLGSVAEEVARSARCPVLIALPKNYQGIAKSESIDPPCHDCIETRRASQRQQFWCERHRQKYAPPHVYEPTHDVPVRSAVMPTH